MMLDLPLMMREHGTNKDSQAEVIDLDGLSIIVSLNAVHVETKSLGGCCKAQ